MKRSQTPIVVAIDFDDTIVVTGKFPEIKGIRKGAKKYINRLYKQGYYIIIWTCRYGVHAEMATRFLQEHGINYHWINQHHPGLMEFFQNDTRKISADIYIDDKNLFFFFHPSWVTIYYGIKLHSLFLKNRLLNVFKK